MKPRQTTSAAVKTGEIALRPVHMGRMAAERIDRPDGSIIVRATEPLGTYPETIVERLRHYAAETPERIFLADRVDAGNGGGEWRHLTYGDAWHKARALASHLLGIDASAERPVVILSGNSIEHGIVALGCFIAGVPYAPISPPYSLVSRDFGKLRHIVSLLTPRLFFVVDAAAFAPALDAAMAEDAELLVARNAPAGRRAVLFDDALKAEDSSAVDAALATLSGDTVAKFLFTSGSTGMPKAVINTHRMLSANQEMIASALAFLRDEPPVMVDWLPWNHTAGGNHNFGITIYNGGSLYIDDGMPTPGGIDRTVRNLAEVAPTLYFNVPKGYEMLATRLAADPALNRNFFSRVKLLQYAGAGLSQHVFDELERLSIAGCGERVRIITGYGSTETAPFAATTTWPVERPGEIGLPARGLEFKLVPNSEKLELRLRGPTITPGYWRDPQKTREAFDEEGFYRIGDALKFVDPDDLSRGLQFDGRISEDFKLATGTWVNFAALRAAIVRGFAPYVRDAVLTGLDRDFVGALLILDVDACRAIADDLAHADLAQLAGDGRVLASFQDRLDRLAAAATGSSTFVAHAAILATPLSIDANEITDKGSTNQRAVMAARADMVEAIYRDPPPPFIIVAKR